MTTATGQYAINYAVLGDANPYSNSDFTNVTGTVRISSGLLRANADWIGKYTGGTYDGTAVGVGFEVNASPLNDEVYGGVLDQNNDGFLLRIRPTGCFVFVYTAAALVDSFGSGSFTLATDDLFTFTCTKGSPNTVAVTRNGSSVTLSQSTYTKTLGNLAGAMQIVNGNVGAGAIKSFAITTGLSVASAKAPPPLRPPGWMYMPLLNM